MVAGTDLTGGGTSGAVTLNLNTAALQTSNDARYAQLGPANTLSGALTVNAELSVSSGDANAGNFVNSSSFYTPINGENSDPNGPIFNAFNPTTGSQCYMDSAADLTCSGQLSGSVVGLGGREIQTYAMQSPENWIEDFGSSQLDGGKATVALDPAFAALINTGIEYHVYLTPGGDSRGLYVPSKNGTSFEVHESSGGKSSAPFDYRVVAKHKGMEKLRLADVTDKMKAARSH